MTEYEQVFKSFDEDVETVEVPDEAIGVTVDTFSHLCTVHYLLPVGEVEA